MENDVVQEEYNEKQPLFRKKKKNKREIPQPPKNIDTREEQTNEIDAKEIIQQNREIDIGLYDIPMDDAKTFELLSSGETAGVFQLEGAGMRRYIKELKPTSFSDIAAMVALYRPGPM